MRIAHFIQRYPPARGGSEAYFQRLSQFLVSQGHQVTVWTSVARALASFWAPTADCLPAGTDFDGEVAVIRFPLWRMRGRRWLLKPLSLLPLRTWQAMTLPCNPVSVRMWREAGNCNEPFDAVHATAFPYAWPIVCAKRLARRQGIPFFLTPFLHLGDPDNPQDDSRRQYTQPALQELLLDADCVFAQTARERATIIELGARPERVILQGLGVDSSECTDGHRLRARHEWSVDDKDVVIGHLANLSYEKGTIDLIRATAMCLPCVVVLAGPVMPNFERFMRARQQNVRVIQLGELSDDGKRNFFAGIDVFALPSRSDSFGLVLLEAWANRVPNVAYRAGGPGEILQHESDGLLVPCGQIEDLSRQINRLIESKHLRAQLGQTGFERIKREFRWEDKLRLVNETIRDVVADRSLGSHVANRF